MAGEEVMLVHSDVVTDLELSSPGVLTLTHQTLPGSKGEDFSPKKITIDQTC